MIYEHQKKRQTISQCSRHFPFNCFIRFVCLLLLSLLILLLLLLLYCCWACILNWFYHCCAMDQPGTAASAAVIINNLEPKRNAYTVDSHKLATSIFLVICLDFKSYFMCSCYYCFTGCCYSWWWWRTMRTAFVFQFSQRIALYRAVDTTKW